MINFLHTFEPRAVALSITDSINIHWYGFFIVIGIFVALLISLRLAKKHTLNQDAIFDLSFWLIIGGLLGARIYDVLLELPFYLKTPLQIFQIWKGGLAIHGAIIAGLIITYLCARYKKINFWKLASIFVPGLALAQAIGRWGNYFNQEIFGQPTNLPWGIPIELANRPIDYLNFQFFHPVFLYESLGCLILGFSLVFLSSYIAYIAKDTSNENSYFYVLTVCSYLAGYSIIRFLLEFIRLDRTPLLLGLRWPQIISLLIIIISALLILIYRNHENKN